MYIIIIIIWYILHYIDIAYTTLPTKNLLKRLHTFRTPQTPGTVELQAKV